MASLIDPRTMSTLSTTGRKLGDLNPELITDVVHIIKQAEIRNWRSLAVFSPIQDSLFFFREREKQKGRQILIKKIVFDPTGELINFYILGGMISLTIDDVRSLQLMAPVSG
jgi:hypothetical protein